MFTSKGHASMFENANNIVISGGTFTAARDYQVHFYHPGEGKGQ
jgi:hypothetical protein